MAPRLCEQGEQLPLLVGSRSSRSGRRRTPRFLAKPLDPEPPSADNPCEYIAKIANLWPQAYKWPQGPNFCLDPTPPHKIQNSSDLDYFSMKILFFHFFGKKILVLGRWPKMAENDFLATQPK